MGPRDGGNLNILVLSTSPPGILGNKTLACLFHNPSLYMFDIYLCNILFFVIMCAKCTWKAGLSCLSSQILGLLTLCKILYIPRKGCHTKKIYIWYFKPPSSQKSFFSLWAWSVLKWPALTYYVSEGHEILNKTLENLKTCLACWILIHFCHNPKRTTINLK